MRGWILSCVCAALSCAIEAAPSGNPVQALQAYLKQPVGQRKPATEDFRKLTLSQKQAEQVSGLLWADHLASLRKERAKEMQAKVIRHGEFSMRFEYVVYGDKPKGGRSLYVSMHGGGNAPARVNDGQWENQKRLYRPKEGIYLAPRSPTNTWNLWHQGHIDPMFMRLIENLVALQDVNPNRVYLMGYSAGGDGVYQVAPRMADTFAAAAMMAGHPNETSPVGLRNLPFAIHVGQNDRGFNRNRVAAEWGDQLAALRKADPKGYVHHVQIHAGRGHWMNREDAVAVDWMARHTRNPLPRQIVWRQDDVLHSDFYWLSLSDGQAKAREEIRAKAEGQRIELTGPAGRRVTVNLKNGLVDLEQPVVIMANGKERYRGRVPRTIGTLLETLKERRDREYLFPARVEVILP